MKNIILFTFILFLSFTFSLSAQGIEFFEGTWEEALQKAKKDNKMIFVDAYTKWCGPCRRMQKNVFPTATAGDFYNKHFINFKMDMETQAGMKFGLSFPVGAYPTLMYFTPEGKISYKTIGGKNVEKLVQAGKSALKSYDKTPDFEKLWNEGDREYSFVLTYLKALNSTGKSTNKVANDYLRSKPNITKDEKSVLLFEATTECDSKLFETMTDKKYFKIIKNIYSEKEISDKIYSSCWKTVEKSFEYDVAELQDEAKKKMKQFNKKKYKEFISKIDLLKSENSNDIDGFLKASKKYFKTLDGTPSKLAFIESTSKKFHGDDKIKKLTEELSEKTFKKDKNPTTYSNYIKVLISNKKNILAIKHLGKAIKMAKDKKDDETLRTLKRYERYLQKIN